MSLKRTLTIDDEAKLPVIYTITSNICKMLIARGIAEEELEEQLNESYPEFESRVSKADSMISPIDVYNEDGTKRYMAVIVPRNKVEKKEIIALIDTLTDSSEESVTLFIMFIVPSKIDPYRNNAKSMIQTIHKKPGVVKFQFFDYAFFQFNLIEHALVPKHTKLTPEEIDHIVHVENILPESLGTLPTNDKVSRYYGYTEGDIIRIERFSEVDLTKIAYRRVTLPGK